MNGLSSGTPDASLHPFEYSHYLFGGGAPESRYSSYGKRLIRPFLLEPSCRDASS